MGLKLLYTGVEVDDKRGTHESPNVFGSSMYNVTFRLKYLWQIKGNSEGRFDID